MTEVTPKLSPENPDHTMFKILRSAVAEAGVVRLGRLEIANRRVINTPNYIAVTSRGTIPHLTPDNMIKHTSFDAAYMAIEDFLEKKEPPILKMAPGGTRNLHSFTAFSPERAIILGPRRFPAVTTPVGNGSQHLSIFTSTGFRQLTIPDFTSTIETLQPDIVIPPADLFHTSTTPASKRQIRMVERTEEWLDDFFSRADPQTHLKPMGIKVFAPVLPVEYPLQWDYLRHLSEDLVDKLSGLAIYDVNILPELSNYPPLAPLPKLSFNPSNSPHEILRHIALGIDLCAISFANSMSDAGVALTFTFPPPETKDVQPLGVDMWSPENTIAVIPLAEGCKCYSCTHHHRAFVNHLLNAKEMLGWNLLQIHNHQVLTDFFAGIRKELAKGNPHFEEMIRKFTAVYEAELPLGTGERPRARGYHFKSIASQKKINQPAWQAFEVEEGVQPLIPGVDGLPSPLVPETNGQIAMENGAVYSLERPADVSDPVLPIVDKTTEHFRSLNGKASVAQSAYSAINEEPTT
ncbi:hypothetical protein G7046_g5108 [Stylonectria norvegica]|nr:hypothetical protein G7046_g5108 [Stylonectria norvegica]